MKVKLKLDYTNLGQSSNWAKLRHHTDRMLETGWAMKFCSCSNLFNFLFWEIDFSSPVIISHVINEKRERKKSFNYNSVSIGYFLLLFVSNEYIQFVHPVSFYAFILTVHISTLVPNKLYWDYWPSTHSRVFCGLKSRVHTSIIFGYCPLVKAYSNFRYTANVCRDLQGLCGEIGVRGFQIYGDCMYTRNPCNFWSKSKKSVDF